MRGGGGAHASGAPTTLAKAPNSKTAAASETAFYGLGHVRECRAERAGALRRDLGGRCIGAMEGVARYSPSVMPEGAFRGCSMHPTKPETIPKRRTYPDDLLRAMGAM